MNILHIHSKFVNSYFGVGAFFDAKHEIES